MQQDAGRKTLHETVNCFCEDKHQADGVAADQREKGGAMSRKVLLTLATVLLLAGFLLWIRQGSRPHVLLITLDTTRADRIGCYGYQ